MPDLEEGVRDAGTIRITCVVTGANAMATFTEIIWKLLLVEAIEGRTITEEIEAVIAATLENKTAKEATEKKRLTGHPRRGSEMTTNRKRQNEDPL